MPIKEVNYEVSELDLGRADRLIARLLGFSRAQVRGLADYGGIIVNGRSCSDPGLSVAKGDQLLLRFDPQRRYREKPPERATQGFTLVYKDDYLVVVNKAAGILTVPTDREESHTLIDRLTRHLYPQNKQRRKVYVVHRLDRDTSGLLVFAHSREIATQLIRQFSAHKPERLYLAIVAGSVQDDAGEIRSFLQSDKSLKQKSAASGELAVTHFWVDARRSDASLLSIKLETGRRNQIRVHFAERGHPVLGDERYEPELAQHPAWHYKRLALHAQSLAFTHPADGRNLSFEAALPNEFLSLRQSLLATASKQKKI